MFGCLLLELAEEVLDDEDGVGDGVLDYFAGLEDHFNGVGV